MTDRSAFSTFVPSVSPPATDYPTKWNGAMTELDGRFPEWTANSALKVLGGYTVTLTASGASSLTVPAGTKTLVDTDSAQTLTNKTLGATAFSGAITGGQAATLGATSVTTLSATGNGSFGGATGSPLIAINGSATGNPYLDFQQNSVSKSYIQYDNATSTLNINTGGGIVGISATGAAVTGTLSTTSHTTIGGRLIVNNAVSAAEHSITSPAASDFALQVQNTAASSPFGMRVTLSGVTGGSGQAFLVCEDDTSRLIVQGDGDVVNMNNSYGAISDLKLKQDIVDAGSQTEDILALQVRKFRFKNNPEGPLMLGLVAQEAEQVSPGLVEASDDMEEYEVEPARTDTKVTQRQKTEFREEVRYDLMMVDGQMRRLPITTTVEVPLFEEHLLFDETGAPIMEIVEPEQPAEIDADGNVVRPAQPAVTRQATVRVPVMEDVVETIEIPAKMGRRPTGTQTKSIKYSVLYMKAVKALQETIVRLEAAEAKIAALEAR